MKYILCFIFFLLTLPFVAYPQTGSSVLSRFPNDTLFLDTMNLKEIVYKDKNYFLFENKISSDSVILISPESLPNGSYILFYSDTIRNKIAIIITYNHKLNKKNEVRYYNNGNIMSQISYRNNKLEGTVRFYYQNGQVQNIDNYSRGMRSGVYKLFNENGIKIYECRYRNNKRVGRELKWDSDGNLIRLR